MLVFVGNRVLDLIEFGEDPWVVFVTVSVEIGEGLEAFFGKPVIDLPSWGFGEEHDQES